MNEFRIVGRGARRHLKIDVYGRDLRDGGTEVPIWDLVAFLTEKGFVTPVDQPESLHRPKKKVVMRERIITPGDELYWGIARRE